MFTIKDIDDVTRNEKIVDIYGTYHTTIAPFILQLETLDGAFPIEILNEVRAIFTHISRCCVTKDIEVYEDNIERRSVTPKERYWTALSICVSLMMSISNDLRNCTQM